VQVSEQISHRLRFGLKAGHGRRTATDDLLDQLAVVLALGDTMQVGAHQTLPGNAMAAGAVEQEQPSARLSRATVFEGGAGVRIGSGTGENQQHHDDAGCGKSHHQCRHKRPAVEGAEGWGGGTGHKIAEGLAVSALGVKQSCLGITSIATMIEPLLCGIVLGLIPVTLLGLFMAAWNQYRRGSLLDS